MHILYGFDSTQQTTQVLRNLVAVSGIYHTRGAPQLGEKHYRKKAEKVSGHRRPKVAAGEAEACVRGGVQSVWRAWATYAAQPTAPAALALALLYCTVMSMARPLSVCPVTLMD